MTKAYWILAIITMSILLITNVIMLIDRIKASKRNKEIAEGIIIEIEEMAKEEKKPRAKKTNLQENK